MMLSDDELLHIEGEPPENYDPEEARRQLAEYGDVYRYQLVQAIELEERAQMLTEQGQVEPWQDVLGTPDWNGGFIGAFREVAASLRCGQYLPGGMLFDHVAPPIEPSE